MYRGHIRLYFRRLLDGVLLRELHIGHVQDAFQRLFDDGMTAATAGGCSRRCGPRSTPLSGNG
jgi:hypothetical protein